ncbi:MAG TPA: N-acetylmuramoyl-L-alanine amidase [Gemmatimonadaceae bacterium]|nr:N-acetylmuramoyl-L-alanine amidase [Gemmatimonadaceae bacterium]
MSLSSSRVAAPSRPVLAAGFAALAFVAGCGTPAPSVQPAPAAGPDSGRGVAAAPPLPPIPLVEGALAPQVVYPAPQHLIESRDSNFVLGSVGNGRATLTINGQPARVYPNGAFLAFLPNPPSAAARYDLVATLGADTARLSVPVRVQPPRPVLAATGPLVVDSASVAPRGNTTLLLRPDDRVHVSVRAPANASAWVTGSSGTQLLGIASTAPDSNGALWAADVAARTLQGAGGATLVVARGGDTASFPLAPVELLDTLATRWVRVGDVPLTPDTDSVIVARPVPGGTYKWFVIPGTQLEMTGRVAGYTRVRLDAALEVWIADAAVHPLPAGTPAPRRVTQNARVRSTPESADLVIPVGDRPAYFVEEGPQQLRLTLYGTRANTDIINYAGNDTLVRTVEWKQVTNDRAELDVYLRRPLYGYLVLWENGNLVLRVRRPPVVDRAHPLRGMIVTVDPGHPPAGATGPTGLYEGQAVLWVGERLRQLLQERGATVVMTRTTMDPVELGLRPILARRAGANAFVSIHLNAYGDGVNPFAAVNGSGTYFFRMLSEPLARSVQRGLVRRMGLPDLGVYYDNLAVVRPTWMPEVLTEGAFVIIPEQEAALQTAEFQERYARGIADGLEQYFRRLAAP